MHIHLLIPTAHFVKPTSRTSRTFSAISSHLSSMLALEPMFSKPLPPAVPSGPSS